ncbi:MAG TPA: SRPBCC family protein [Polyangiales bacterium]|nr:SRPBCC family protein [Polyangiales bacterium]
MSQTDKIEKHVTLRASRSRVFRALTEAEEFGSWFLARFDGPFVAGQPVTGRITHPGFEHLRFTLWVERIEPERYFSFRWHPYAVDPKVDYSAETPTLVEFFLEEAKDGVALRIVESGFDRLPASRRDEAFRMNEGGWSEQAKNIERYVAR